MRSAPLFLFRAHAENTTSFPTLHFGPRPEKKICHFSLHTRTSTRKTIDHPCEKETMPKRACALWPHYFCFRAELHVQRSVGLSLSVVTISYPTVSTNPFEVSDTTKKYKFLLEYALTRYSSLLCSLCVRRQS
jgi:hypothetical protein